MVVFFFEYERVRDFVLVAWKEYGGSGSWIFMSLYLNVGFGICRKEWI